MDAKLLVGWMRKKEDVRCKTFWLQKGANDHEKCEPTTTYCFKMVEWMNEKNHIFPQD